MPLRNSSNQRCAVKSQNEQGRRRLLQLLTGGVGIGVGSEVYLPAAIIVLIPPAACMHSHAVRRRLEHSPWRWLPPSPLLHTLLLPSRGLFHLGWPGGFLWTVECCWEDTVELPNAGLLQADSASSLLEGSSHVRSLAMLRESPPGGRATWRRTETPDTCMKPSLTCQHAPSGSWRQPSEWPQLIFCGTKLPGEPS